jgi:hypothetical protein
LLTLASVNSPVALDQTSTCAMPDVAYRARLVAFEMNATVDPSPEMTA